MTITVESRRTKMVISRTKRQIRIYDDIIFHSQNIIIRNLADLIKFSSFVKLRNISIN